MKPAGTWDFDGACAPGRAHGRHRTFSLGCFQWIPKASGKGTKRGKVVKRFVGLTDDPESAFEQARAWCTERNAEA